MSTLATIETLQRENGQLIEEIARLRKAHEDAQNQKPQLMQTREIGEGDWVDCNDEAWFTVCEMSPLYDTRKLYTATAIHTIEKPDNQAKANQLMEFVNGLVGAYISNFTDYPHMTLQQLHRVAQHHVKDGYGIDVKEFSQLFGMDLFNECRAISEQWETPTAQPWQPIETAPTEPLSTAIIYAPSDTHDGTVGEAFLGKDGQWYWAGSEVGYHDPITDCNSPPTHWMPMPAKPKSQEAA